MSIDIIHIGAGAVLATVVVRTGIAIVLSVRGHQRGESGWGILFQSASDLILATGAVLYANTALRPDAPRAFLAGLLVFAIAWEASVGGSRVAELGNSPEALQPMGVENFLDTIQIFGWMFMTLMLIAFSAMVVMARPVLTDAQKLAPIVGISVPIVVGLILGDYVRGRDPEQTALSDGVAVILGGSALGFACWVWL
jgi:hypothetical protein